MTHFLISCVKIGMRNLMVWGLFAPKFVFDVLACVTIGMRNLMVWGLFAPKFVFDVLNLTLTHLSKISIGKSEGEGEGGVDMISDLPNDVLCHILSFLPSVEVVRTGLVSKKWRHLWEIVPALSIQWLPSEDTTKEYYLKTVDEFLRLRKTKKTTRFHLNIRQDFIEEFTIYIYEAFIGEVEHVNLCLNAWHWQYSWSHGTVSLPMRLFTCNTIVTMKIEGSDVNLLVPSGIQLPSLKSLHLNVRKCEPSCKEFLSGSPALQVFYLKQGWWGLGKLRIEQNSQRSFIRANNPLLNLKIESHRRYNYIQDYVDGHLENIVKAKVSMTVIHRYNQHSYSTSEVYHHAFSILNSLCNVEYLSLRDRIRSFVDTSSHDLPQFPNLVHLDLHALHYSPFLKLSTRCPKLEMYCLNCRCKLKVIHPKIEFSN